LRVRNRITRCRVLNRHENILTACSHILIYTEAQSEISHSSENEDRPIHVGSVLLVGTGMMVGFLFIYLIHATNQSRHPQGICGKAAPNKRNEANCRPSAGQQLHMRSIALHSALWARLGGRSTPIQQTKGKEKEKHARQFYPSPHSSRPLRVSHTIHSSILAA